MAENEEGQSDEKSSIKNFRFYQTQEIFCNRNINTCRLGKGSFGTVYYGFQRASGVIAIKCFEMTGGTRKRKITKKKVEKEMKLLQKSLCEHVVQLYGWTQWQGFIGIIMEYLPAGNLMEALEDNDVKLRPILRLRMCYEVADGISFIHNIDANNPLVHGDLKPENVLLTESLKCKIADFGSAKLSNFTDSFTKTSHSQNGNPFTSLYAAPEVLENPSIPLVPSRDTYSFAILMYMVLNREYPLSSQHMHLYVENVKNGTRPDLSNIDDQIREEKGQTNDASIIERMKLMMEKCWQQTPLDRPDMARVREELEKEFYQCESASVRVNEAVGVALKEIVINKPLRCDQKDLISLSSGFLQPHDSDCETTNSTLDAPPLFGSSSNENHLLPSKVESFDKNAPTTSISDRKFSIVEKFLSIENSIRHGRIDEAGDDAVQFVLATNILQANDDITTLITKAVEVSNLFYEKSRFIASLQMIGFIINSYDQISDPKERLTKINDSYRIVYYNAWSLYQDYRTNEIQELCLPILCLMNEKIKTTRANDYRDKAYVETKCVLCIGWCNYFIENFSQAENIGEKGRYLISEVYREDSKKKKPFAGCYILLAATNHGMEKYDEAIPLYKRCIELYQTAENINENERKERIETARRYLKEAENGRLLKVMVEKFLNNC